MRISNPTTPHLIKRLPATLMLMLVTVALIYLPGCSRSPEGSFIAGTWKYQEVKRVKSPDSRFEVVIITGDAGATTATRTFVVVVPMGMQIDTNTSPSEAVFVADHLKGFKVLWKNNQFLMVQYDEARISDYENLKELLVGQEYYPIEIRLAPTSQDFSVPLDDRVPFSTK